MAEYKYHPLSAQSIIRTRDGAVVPANDPSNGDSRAFQAWLTDSHTPDPADPPPPAVTQQRASALTLRDSLKTALANWATLPPAQKDQAFVQAISLAVQLLNDTWSFTP